MAAIIVMVIITKIKTNQDMQIKKKKDNNGSKKSISVKNF